MSPPLLSEYKRSFAVKRACQNALGGLRLIGVPFQLGFIQVFLFLVPAIVFGTVTACCSNLLEIHYKLGVLGGCLLIVEVGLSVGIFTLKKERNAVRPKVPSIEMRLFAQEDSISFDGWLASTTWCFVTPNVTFTAGHVLAILISTLTLTLTSPLLFDWKNELGLQILGGLVLCTSRYSSTLSAPPEVAIFGTNQKRSIFLRPFYVGAIGLAYMLHSGCLTVSINGFPYLLTLCLLPIGWAFGFLPPLDALLPWAIETALHQLGGSPSYFYFGSFIGLCLALLYVVLVFVVGSHDTAGVALQSVFGYLILLDTSGIFSLVSRSGSRFSLRGKPRFLATVFIMAISLTGALLVSKLQTPMMHESCQHVVAGVTAASVAVLVALKLVCGNTSFKYSGSWIHLILTKALVILIHVWLTIEIVEEGRLHGESEVRSLFHLTAIALNIRAYAQALTTTNAVALDMLITTVLRILTAKQAFPNELEFTAVLFLVGVSRRSLARCLSYVVSIVRISWADLTSPMLDNKVTIGGVCLIFMPISLCSLVIASFLEGFTLVPVFTLPVFLLGFPRPITFWKGKWFRRKQLSRPAENGSLDEALYSALGPTLVTEFVRRATLDRGLKAREVFFARYEDRLVFLQVVGSCLNSVYVGVRGLELHEQTSCHHQESAWMDEIFEKHALRTGFQCGVSKDKLTVIRPLFAVNVPTYSESKSTLPYLIAEIEKVMLEEFFFKTLSFLWIKGKPAFQGEAYWNTGSRPTYYGTNEEREDPISHSARSAGRIQTNETWPTPVDAKLKLGPSLQDRSTSWIKKCVGEAIPSNAIKERMEKLASKIWKLVHTNNDFREIKLHRYFENDFLLDEALNLKTLDTDNIFEITKKSFRYAAKLALDEMYQLDFSEEPTGSSEDETFTQLCTFESDWAFCQPNELTSFLRDSTFPSVQASTRTILCIFPKEEGMSQMRIFVPEPDGVKFNIASVDAGVVQGIWANLHLELLYFTSDDDERFSIQHDRHLMRNLCTECADTPLGYPVYEATFRVDLFKNFKVEAVG